MSVEIEIVNIISDAETGHACVTYYYRDENGERQGQLINVTVSTQALESFQEFQSEFVKQRQVTPELQRGQSASDAQQAWEAIVENQSGDMSSPDG